MNTPPAPAPVPSARQVTQTLAYHRGASGCTPGLPAPRTAFLASFLPASSRKSAKLGGGPCNKSAAAMETRPGARGRVPAGLHS